jgi:hypothetical protein
MVSQWVSVLWNQLLPYSGWKWTRILPRKIKAISTIHWQLHSLFKNELSTKVRSSATALNLEYHLVPLKSSSSCLRLLPHLSFTSILPSTFSSQKYSNLWLLSVKLQQETNTKQCLCLILYDNCQHLVTFLDTGSRQQLQSGTDRQWYCEIL